MRKLKPTSPSRYARIFLVDDHPLIRHALRMVIENEVDMTVCGEADDRHRALDEIAVLKPELAIVDLSLRNSNGLDLVKDLRRDHPSTFSLVLSMHDETIHAERCIRAGARGFICKTDAGLDIVSSIRKVLSGEIHWSQQVATQIASRFACDVAPSAGVEALSDRELEIFEMIGLGKNTSQMAATLEVHASTVETYRSRIKGKLNLKDGGALLENAIRWHISKACHSQNEGLPTR